MDITYPQNLDNPTGCNIGIRLATLCIEPIIKSVVAIVSLMLIFVGSPSPNGAKYNVDIFPPRIWDMNEVEEALTTPIPDLK